MRVLILTAILFLKIHSANAQTAFEVVQRADNNMRGQSMIAEISIRISRPTWERTMDVKAWTLGRDYSLILIQSPPRERGVVFLKRKKELWNWLPALERTIKLPPSMMSQSWMGTDFTNDDLVRESSVVYDYEHRFLSDTLIRQQSCFRIEMIPKPDAPVVWSKIIIAIAKEAFIELNALFFDEDGLLSSCMNAYDIRNMDGRKIPTRFEMIPLQPKNQKTEMIYRNVLFNRQIPEERFNLSNIRNPAF